MCVCMFVFISVTPFDVVKTRMQAQQHMYAVQSMSSARCASNFIFLKIHYCTKSVHVEGGGGGGEGGRVLK